MLRQHHSSLRPWAIFGLALTVSCFLAGSVYAQPQETFQAGQFYVFGSDPAEPVPSAARFNRTLDEARATFHLSGLDPMAAYSVWVVVFNNPAGCTTNPEAEVRCGVADLMLTPNLADASAFNEGALVTDSDGTANAVAHIRSGPLPDGAFVLWGAGGANDNGVSPGLREGNGFGAEIHLVLRNHQQILPDAIVDQLTLFDGGCPPNTCTNQLVVTFAAIPSPAMP
jgi:hypothetical protein